MTEVNFRDIPPPRYPEDELASEPWYSVSPGDVFPEEFRHWLCAAPALGHSLKRCTPTCSALITGAHYKTVFVKDMWKMFMRIGAGKDLAYGMGRCFLSKASI